MKLKCVKSDGDGGQWTRYVEFPFPPFPGMVVGYHTVKEVQVCQGDLDGSGSIEVHLTDVEANEEHILRGAGWKYLS